MHSNLATVLQVYAAAQAAILPDTTWWRSNIKGLHSMTVICFVLVPVTI